MQRSIFLYQILGSMGDSHLFCSLLHSQHVEHSLEHEAFNKYLLNKLSTLNFYEPPSQDCARNINLLSISSPEGPCSYSRTNPISYPSLFQQPATGLPFDDLLVTKIHQDRLSNIEPNRWVTLKIS